MEDDFILNQRLLNQLRRIKPRNKSCENINRDKSKSTSRFSEHKLKKKSKGSNIYITNINQNQMNKNNSMCSLPSI